MKVGALAALAEGSKFQSARNTLRRLGAVEKIFGISAY
jgi:hypothetical protein